MSFSMFGKRSDFNVNVFATLYRINVCKWKFFAEIKWKQYIPIDNITLIWFLEQIQNYQKNIAKTAEIAATAENENCDVITVPSPSRC